MELSSIEIRYIVNYVNSKLIAIGGYYLSQINGITKDSLALKFHHSIERDILLIISTKGMWVTKKLFKQVEENDLVRNAKKELERSRIISIEQLDSERIVFFKFEHPNNTIRYLICEFFGQGNIIICDETMKILSILNQLEVRHRTLRIGLKYSPPPSKGLDIFKISIQEFDLQYQNETRNLEISKWLGRSLSLPKKFVEEILFRGNIDNNKKIKEMTTDNLLSIFTNTKKIVEEVISENKHSPIVILDTNNVPFDASHLPLKIMKDSNIKSMDSFMDALDEVLCNDIITIGKRFHTLELDKKLSTLEHDLLEQEKAKQKVLAKSNTIRKLASDLMNILSYNPIELNNLLNRHSSKLIMEKGKKYLIIGEELIQFNDNVRKVSSLLYERAKEMERGSETIDNARLKILDEIADLKRKTNIAEKKIDVKEQKSKEWFERYRWFITSEDLLVIGGRDASSNSAIIRKHMTEMDIVFHAEIHGSPFFLIKNIGLRQEDINQNSQSLLEGAIATVSFSRAWKDGLSSADAYWVFPNQVKKGAPTGQFLPKGSFVIEGKRNFVKGLELKLSIGVTKENNNYKMICGPLESIKSKSIIYSILLPGTLDPMHAAKKIKTELINNSQTKTELTEFLKKVSLDDIIRILPSGKIKIVLSERGKLFTNL
ncbi:MAG TPA: ribosome rescue protein RqcH [Nitrososphaeraceae archaeon]|nr:ribosome rescue protein RqcH [Nitrososphaeraceae archaeon]